MKHHVAFMRITSSPRCCIRPEMASRADHGKKKSFLTDIFFPRAKEPYNALLPITSTDWPLRAAHPCALRSISSLRLSFCVPPFCFVHANASEVQNIRSKFNISTMSWPGIVGSSVESHFLILLLLGTRASTRLDSR
jgi:hypothetical protein